MKDLFFRMILLLIIVYMTTNVIANNAINNRYVQLSKTDSSETLRDYNKFNIIKNIVDNYNKYVLENKYSQLSNITLFNAKKDNNFYSQLKNESSLSQSSTIKINEMKVLSEDVYKCKYSIISNNKKTDVTMVVMLMEQDHAFKIINVEI